MSNDLALVSLFAGVGGFDLAAANIGIPTIAAVEIDDHARGVLKHRFPTTNLFTDVKEVTGSDLRAGFMGRVILCGGFPCQDLSIAGKRAGLAGGRSGLFWEIIRIAEEIDAEAVVLENVPGLISSNGGRDFGTVIGALAELGYRVGWRVLDAQHFGVPQRRRRIFIIASRVGAETLAEILFESESSSGDLETGDETRQNTTADTTDSTAIGGGIGSVTFSKSRRAASIDDYETWVERDTTNTLNTFDNAADTRATELVVDAVAYPIREDAVAGNFSATEIDTSLCLQAQQPSPQSHHAQTFIAHPTIVRRLTPTECERLQGFPDGWTTHRHDFKKNTVVEQADSARYKQMGNAVAVPVVQWLLTRLAVALDA
jgi:DNA (cytosine-5)-methyltransferase 1